MSIAVFLWNAVSFYRNGDAHVLFHIVTSPGLLPPLHCDMQIWNRPAGSGLGTMRSRCQWETRFLASDRGVFASGTASWEIQNHRQPPFADAHHRNAVCRPWLVVGVHVAVGFVFLFISFFRVLQPLCTRSTTKQSVSVCHRWAQVCALFRRSDCGNFSLGHVLGLQEGSFSVFLFSL